MALRNYSAVALGTTITSGINNVTTTIPVAATTGFPSTPFIAILEPDTTNEEVVLVTNVAGLNLTVTRGYDSTTAVAHVINMPFQHSFSAIDFREPNAFINPQAAETFSAWSGVTTGSIAVGAGLTTGALNLATVGTGATPIGIGHTNAVLTLTGASITLAAATIDLSAVADTATAATHYFVETATDGDIRPKTLANVKTEIVTTAAVNSAAATTVGTVTSGTWSAGVIAGQYGGTGVANTGKTITVSGNTTIGSSTHTVTFATSGNTSVTLPASGTLVNDAVTALSSLATVGTVTSGTWSSLVDKGTLNAPMENCNVSATAAGGTINVDTDTAAVWYYTTSASANFTLNFRAASGTTLASRLAVGDAISVVFMNTNGATPYYANAFQIDTASVTPKWSGGVAPAAGNASAIDAYSFTIIKTAATPTYTVLAGAVKFA